MSAQEPQSSVSLEVETTETKPEIRLPAYYYSACLMLLLIITAAFLASRYVDGIIITEAGFSVVYILGRIKTRMGLLSSAVLVAPHVFSVFLVIVAALYSHPDETISGFGHLLIRVSVALQVATFVWGYALIRRYNARRVAKTSISTTL